MLYLNVILLPRQLASVIPKARQIKQLVNISRNLVFLEENIPTTWEVL